MGCCYKALSDETRRKIMEILAKGNATAGDIARQFKITQPTVSNHLKILKESGLIKEKKAAQKRIYSLNRQRLKKVVSTLNQILEN